MRKVLFTALTILMLGGCERLASNSISSQEWSNYQSHFISPEGRVIDTGNSGISHSEGQGYAMLLAVAAGERRHFDRIWAWTQRNLQIRDDHLFAWKWDPHSSNPVVDKNNASDGDLLIAWALYRAAQSWKNKSYRLSSLEITKDIRKKLIINTKSGPVLLPGEKGFIHNTAITLNPSYWVFPAFRALQEMDADPVWNNLIDSGNQLLYKNQFGQYHLPADWIVLRDGTVSLSETLSSRFSFDAMRIPLYVCWDKKPVHASLKKIDEFWNIPAVPAWIDLGNGKTADFGLVYGQQAIRQLLRRCLGSDKQNITKVKTEKNRPIAKDYYSSTLYLLSRVAALEAGF